jgi:hypothetical protein
VKQEPKGADVPITISTIALIASALVGVLLVGAMPTVAVAILRGDLARVRRAVTTVVLLAGIALLASLVLAADAARYLASM